MPSGIIAVGADGTALAQRLVAAGEQVLSSNSRGPEAVRRLVAATGPGRTAEPAPNCPRRGRPQASPSAPPRGRNCPREQRRRAEPDPDGIDMICAAVPSEPLAARCGHLLRVLAADHAKPLLAYVERILGEHHMAEDIVQETLIRAWHHSDRLCANDGSVRGWLLTVARNLAIDRIRSAYSRHESPGTDHPGPPHNDHADTVANSVDTMTLLRHLSPEHQEVLVHTYLNDRTVQETAQLLGIPPGTVKSRQHYALRQLRNRIRTRMTAETAAQAAAA